MGEKTVCIDNEIPFSIPSSWCWQRLCSVCFINPSVNTDDASEVSFVTMKDIQAGFVNSFSSSKTLWKSVKTNFTHFQNEDIGLAKITPCFENRKSVIFKGLINGIGAGTTELNIIRVDQRILLNEYLLYLLKSDYLINYGISKFTGAVGQQRFGGIALKQFLIPIPPFEEQKRLCNTIVGCLQYANSIGKNLSELNKNCNTLKSKILDSFFGEHSRYKSYCEQLRDFEEEVTIFDNIRKPINREERQTRMQGAKQLFPYYGATGLAGYIDEYLLEGEYVLLGEDAAPFLDKNATKAYIVSGQFWVNNHAHILQSKTNNRFLMYYLNWYDYSKIVSGTTRLKLSQSQMKTIKFPSFPESLKVEIVDYIAHFFEIIDKMIEQS